MEAKSARVSDVEWKEQLAQLREDLLRTSSSLVEVRNGETKKAAELTDQMRRLQSPIDDRQRSSYAVVSTTRLKHMSVITDDAVRILTLLNMKVF